MERELAKKAAEQARAKYQDLTKVELADRLADRGLPKTGNVDELELSPPGQRRHRVEARFRTPGRSASVGSGAQIGFTRAKVDVAVSRSLAAAGGDKPLDLEPCATRLRRSVLGGPSFGGRSIGDIEWGGWDAAPGESPADGLSGNGNVADLVDITTEGATSCSATSLTGASRTRSLPPDRPRWARRAEQELRGPAGTARTLASNGVNATRDRCSFILRRPVRRHRPIHRRSPEHPSLPSDLPPRNPVRDKPPDQRPVLHRDHPSNLSGWPGGRSARCCGS